MQRTALITGAGKGVGRSLAIGLAKQGINVGLISQTPSDLEIINDIIQRETTSKVCTAVADVGSWDEVEKAVITIKSELGPIDILINNAATGVPKTVIDIDHAEFERVVQVNLLGTFYVTKLVLQDMMENNFGDIINISSILGDQGAALNTAYSASKFGVNGFTDSLRMECANTNVRVSLVSPGGINTRMNVDDDTPDAVKETLIQPNDFVNLISTMINLPRNVNLARANFRNFNMPK